MSAATVKPADLAQAKALGSAPQPAVPCPRCGRSARVIGSSEAFMTLYLRCDECRQTSVAPA